MNYNEALKIFEFTCEFTKEELKKRYLELSKKYHPDLNGDENMMKEVNSAYEILKSHNESNDLMKYYVSLKEGLYFYASKTIYLPDTIEFKYANAITDVIEKFFCYDPITLLDFEYSMVVGKIKALFVDYKKEVLKRVPNYFESKFDIVDIDCSFDEYVRRVNKIGIKYDEINSALNNVIKSMNSKMAFEIMEEIKNIKEIIIKGIVDKRLTLEDGVNRLQSEIKTRILKEETLNKDIWDTYSFIRGDLKQFDTKDIDIIMQVLFNKDMTILINKYYKDKIQKDDIKYELYIALKDVDDEFEIVLKKSEDNRFVSFLKKNCNDSNIVEEYLITMEEFYTKYYRFVNYLDKAIFKGIRVFVQDFSLSPQKSILLYYIDCIAVVLMENEEVLILKNNKFFLKEPYDLMNKSEQFNDKQVFYDKIYNSFFEREEEIKLKREKNE